MISVISAAVAMGVLVVGRGHFVPDLSDAMCAILRITISSVVMYAGEVYVTICKCGLQQYQEK